ncbi:protein SOSEKI 5-like isoform X2 [Amaranthus tricolor]|uniref:protein SOSEKI 5-like isoform X2 n=1 Tax=Amaranthus tricolor TaxID=29722 RepID=UPI002585133A|nr:protein SOSEKI 5-like isoform X2 [Amaranthus tricolor]
MAVELSRARNDQLHLQKFKDKQDNLEFHHYSTISMIDHNQTQKRVSVPVVYYLSRNGQLEHPHFIEVPLSSSQGLFLRDVINRLNLLRGKSMPSHYSWSSKRSYKNGYVWHDLEENDFIHPVHGGEYILKGSEILVETVSNSSDTLSSPSAGNNIPVTVESEFPVTRNRRRNQSCGSIEYKVYKTESTHEFSEKAAADASTQTDDKRRRIEAVMIKEEPEEEEGRIEKVHHEQVQEFSTELSRYEISPPPSDSSPETLESLMKATISSSSSSSQSNNQTVGSCPSGRMKASSVLMSLISCGSISFRDCGAATVKDHGLSLMSHYKSRLPRGVNQTVEESNGVTMDIENTNVYSSFSNMGMEDKEYFSGSLIETKRNELPTVLKRSSSYNADSSHLMKLEKKVEGVRAKCIRRKPRTQTCTSKKELDAQITRVTNTINSTHGLI